MKGTDGLKGAMPFSVRSLVDDETMRPVGDLPLLRSVLWLHQSGGREIS